MTEEQRQEERESIERVRAEYGVDATFTGTFHQLYFHRDEPPFDGLRAEDGTYVLALDDAPDRKLEVSLLPAHELVPFFDVNPLPASFSYPMRRWSLWALGIGLALFFLLPYPRRPGNVIAYQRWRILMGDIASTLLFAVFFVLPFPIIGGSVEALRTLPLLIPFWLLASLALVASYWGAHAAVYCLVMRDGGFEIRPPKWLVLLSFGAVLLGGSRTAKDGRSRFIWVSDQMGGEAMEHLAAFVAGLETAGVPRSDDVVTVRGIFPPS